MPFSSEEQICRAFLNQGFAPFRIARSEILPSKREFEPDLLLDLEWDGVIRTFVVSTKRRWSPRTLAAAVLQVKIALDTVSNTFPMIVTPYLPPEALDRLLDEKVSGIDLSGNGLVIVPGQWLVMRTGSKNRYPLNDPIKNVYRGNSSLAARLFLLRPEYPSVPELQAEIERRGSKLALSTIYKVLQTMEEDLLIERKDTIKLLQPARLLDLLTENFRRPIIKNRIRGRAVDRNGWLARFVESLRRREESVVCDSPARYAVMPGADTMITVYASSLDGYEKISGFEETERFPTLELRETDDPLVYFDPRNEEDLPWTSPLQVYLKLSTGGKRERETAEQIRERLLAFEYGGLDGGPNAT